MGNSLRSTSIEVVCFSSWRDYRSTGNILPAAAMKYCFSSGGEVWGKLCVAAVAQYMQWMVHKPEVDLRYIDHMTGVSLSRTLNPLLLTVHATGVCVLMYWDDNNMCKASEETIQRGLMRWWGSFASGLGRWKFYVIIIPYFLLKQTMHFVPIRVLPDCLYTLRDLAGHVNISLSSLTNRYLLLLPQPLTPDLLPAKLHHHIPNGWHISSRQSRKG